MKILPDNRLTAWGTIGGAVVSALTLFGTVIVYEVRTAEGVANCTRAVEHHETRLDSIDNHVNNIEGFLRGRAAAGEGSQVAAREEP